MAEYVNIAQLWNCETCFHNRGGVIGCITDCDHGESYRPARSKLKIADVAPVVHVRWEHDSVGFDDFWRCSACREDWFFEYDPEAENTRVNYCPNCGARMDGEG